MSSKRAILCYLPPRDGTQRFINHAGSFRTREELKFFSDVRWPNLNSIMVPPVDYKPGHLEGPDGFALISWQHAINLAQSLDLDEFLLIEDDCLFACDYWDSGLWDDYDAKPGVDCCGTPTAHFYIDSHLDWQRLIIEKSKECLDQTLHPLTIQGTRGYGVRPVIYTNGALTVFRTKAVHKAFKSALTFPCNVSEESECWDFAFGRWLVEEYGFDVFDHIAFSSRTFSCCGDFPLPTDALQHLVNKGLKTAVHSVK